MPSASPSRIGPPAWSISRPSRAPAWSPWAPGSPACSATTTPFCDEFLESRRQTGERAWRLPLDDDFKESLKSHVADLKNVGGKWGGASTAAKFLEQFVANTPWIHLDIAGPSWADSDSPTRDIGATGCFVRTLVHHCERMAGNE